MPAFVPVFDPEVPRSEQDPNSKELIKHRRWDNPYSLINVPKDGEVDENQRSRSYYKDKYNDNNNLDNKRDDRFYRKPVHDEFDYVVRKRKKGSKTSSKVKDENRTHESKKPLKAVKKDSVKRE